MKQKLTPLLVAIATTLSLAFAVAIPAVVGAGGVDLFPACSGNSDSEICKARSPAAGQSIVGGIISALMWVIGAVSVIMIVVAGIKYTTSNGDANKIQSAKNTLLYAVIGVVVAILGQAIVLFVVNRVT